MNTDPGKLYVLPPRGGQMDSDAEFVVNDSDSDLMGLAQSMSFTRERDRHAAHAPSIIVVASDPSRYRVAEFEAVDVKWVVLDTPLEAIDHLLNRGDVCAAVLTEIDLKGRDNGYRVVEALRACGYAGPLLVVTTRELLAAERALVKRRGATGSVVFRSRQMLHTLHAIVAGLRPTSSGTAGPFHRPGQHHYPAWVPAVIKQLARFAGPCAGEIVRKIFVDLYARRNQPPRRMELVDEAADVLTEWPDDKLRFLALCRAMKKGEA